MDKPADHWQTYLHLTQLAGLSSYKKNMIGLFLNQPSIDQGKCQKNRVEGSIGKEVGGQGGA